MGRVCPHAGSDHSLQAIQFIGHMHTAYVLATNRGHISYDQASCLIDLRVCSNSCLWERWTPPILTTSEACRARQGFIAFYRHGRRNNLGEKLLGLLGTHALRMHSDGPVKPGLPGCSRTGGGCVAHELHRRFQECQRADQDVLISSPFSLAYKPDNKSITLLNLNSHALVRGGIRAYSQGAFTHKELCRDGCGNGNRVSRDCRVKRIERNPGCAPRICRDDKAPRIFSYDFDTSSHHKPCPASV